MRRLLTALFGHVPCLSRGCVAARGRRLARPGVESLEDRLALDGRGPFGAAAAVPEPVRTRIEIVLPPPGGEEWVIVAPRGGLGSNPNPDDPDEPSGPGAPVIHVLGVAALARVPVGLIAEGGAGSAYPNPDDDGSAPTFPPGYVGPNPGPVSRINQMAAARQAIRLDPQPDPWRVQIIQLDPEPEPWTPPEVPGIGQQAGF